MSLNPPPVIPNPNPPYTPSDYPNYSPNNGLGCISPSENDGIGISEYGLIMFKNLQSQDPYGQILLNAEGITKNAEPTIEWGSISTALENIVAVVPPQDSTTLEINNKIIITDGASNQITFNAVDNSISATTNLTVAPITTFNQNVKSILPPQAPEDLINLAYLQTFPPASQLDLFLNYDSFPVPPIDTYSLLSGIDITPATTNQTTITTGGSPVFITGFANQIANLSVGSYIPAGIWNMSLFCNVTTSTPIGALNIFWRLYGRTSLGIETQISGDSSLFNLITIAPVVIQTAMSLGIPETDLTPYESLVVKIYGTISSGSRIVNTYYEGDHQYSYVKTSFGVYVPPSILTTSNTWTGFNTFDNGLESNGTTSITGALYDSMSLAGTAGQLLASSGSTIKWVSPAPVPPISAVLAAGNVSTNQSITGLDSITATTLNSTDCTIDNLLDATSITTNGILVKNSQSWSSGGVIVANTNVICPNFTGLASKATNLAGGLGGQIPYQSAVNTTALLANGTAGKYLQTNGTTLAPSWTTPPLYFPAITVANSAAVMGGSSYPQAPTTAQSNTGYDGWCFTNTTAGSAISWAMGGRSPTSVLGDYKGWYFCFMINVATATPFLNVYTLPATAPNFFNSRRTFITSGTGATPLVVGTPYIAYWQQDPSYPIPTRYGHTPFPLEMATGYVGAQIGAFANTETYYFMTVGSNSGSVVNTQSFIVSEAANVFANGIEPYQFLGSSVATTNSTNIVGGLGGSIPYQSAVNTTALLANGASTYVLQSNGTTLAPSWVETVAKAASAQLALVSQRLAFGNAGSIPYQTAPNQTSFIVNGTAGYVLTANGGTLAPTWNASSAGATPTIAQVLTAGSVATAGQTITGLTSITATNFTGLASTSTNLAGGLGGSIPYQSAVNTTALLANGSVGQVLTSAGTTLPPTWQNAGASSNAANIIGGSVGQIPYQSAPSTTLFILAGTQNQVLIANNTGVPSWTDAVLLPAYGLCSFRTNNYTQTVGIGFGQTSYINNAVLTTQYISAFGVTFPATNGQFTVVNGGAYTVNIRVNLQSSGAILSSTQLFLYSVTGAAIVLGTIQNYQYSTASATSNIVMEVNTIVPLVTGNTYQVGFIQNYTGTISGVVINFCYISINRIF